MFNLFNLGKLDRALGFIEKRPATTSLLQRADHCILVTPLEKSEAFVKLAFVQLNRLCYKQSLRRFLVVIVRNEARC